MISSVTHHGIVDMWGTPIERIAARHFVRLPAPQRRTRPSAWLARRGRPQSVPAFGEAPTIGPDGQLYVVDVAWGRVFTIADGGDVHTVLEYDGEPNGLAFTPQGDVVIADYRRGLLSASVTSRGWDPPRTELTSVAGRAFDGLNDALVVPSLGAVFLTDQGDSGLQDPSGRVIRVGADGAATVVLGGIPSPNALAYDADLDSLYVAVTRDNAVWRIPELSDAPVSRVGRYLQLSGGTGPDGICVGPASSLFVTHLGLGVVYGFDVTGILRAVIDCRPYLEPTGVVYDGRRVLITESTGSVLEAKIPEGFST